MIIGLCGFAGSGKDTAADIICDRFEATKVSLADPLKRICKDVFDFSIEQLWGPSEKRNEPDRRYLRKEGKIFDEKLNEFVRFTARDEYLTPRYALQQLGTEWGRGCYPNIWAEKAVRVAQDLLKVASDLDYRKRSTGGWDHDPHPYCYEASEGAYWWDMAVDHGQLSSDGLPIYTKHKLVIIPDVRFRSEIVVIRKAGGKVLRVKRKPFDVTQNHASEYEQSTISDNEFDGVIDNRGDRIDLKRTAQIAVLDHVGHLDDFRGMSRTVF